MERRLPAHIPVLRHTPGDGHPSGGGAAGNADAASGIVDESRHRGSKITRLHLKAPACDLDRMSPSINEVPLLQQHIAAANIVADRRVRLDQPLTISRLGFYAEDASGSITDLNIWEMA